MFMTAPISSSHPLFRSIELVDADCARLIDGVDDFLTLASGLAQQSRIDRQSLGDMAGKVMLIERRDDHGFDTSWFGDAISDPQAGGEEHGPTRPDAEQMALWHLALSTRTPQFSVSIAKRHPKGRRMAYFAVDVPLDADAPLSRRLLRFVKSGSN